MRSGRRARGRLGFPASIGAFEFRFSERISRRSTDHVSTTDTECCHYLHYYVATARALRTPNALRSSSLGSRPPNPGFDSIGLRFAPRRIRSIGAVGFRLYVPARFRSDFSPPSPPGSRVARSGEPALTRPGLDVPCPGPFLLVPYTSHHIHGRAHDAPDPTGHASPGPMADTKPR